MRIGSIREKREGEALVISTLKHEEIVRQLAAEAEADPNVVGFLVFGSVAAGTQRPDSDIDLATILLTSQPASGIHHSTINDIQVGNIFLTFEVFSHGIRIVPYLLHPLAGAKLLLNRGGMIKPLCEKLQSYFLAHPEIVCEWEAYYRRLKQEKTEFGCEKTTIIEVWNELERKHSGRRIKRKFFNSFYMTNNTIFSQLKKLM